MLISDLALVQSVVVQEYIENRNFPNHKHDNLIKDCNYLSFVYSLIRRFVYSQVWKSDHPPVKCIARVRTYLWPR